MKLRFLISAVVIVVLGIGLTGCGGGGQSSGKLTTEVTPKDGGTVSRDLNQEIYPAGTNVTLTAEAAFGYIFKEWTGAATGTAKSIGVATVGNMKVTAVFEKMDDLAMISVQGGTFTMGCTGEQRGCGNGEKPVHSVTLGNFQIGKYEVTQRLWTKVMGANPSNFEGDDLPVENVSWNNVQEFIKKLNEQTGKKYRLPTEAEWEYASRGGNKSGGYMYSGSNNINDVAWYDGNNNNQTQPIGTKAPNELGIHDMSGNVWEWVSDWYGDYNVGAKTNPQGSSSDSFRVIRGGSWSLDARFCRVSNRNPYDPSYRDSILGFRLAVSP
ncbi:MAG: SUMF1/EgtB/PvdO family nonheme iron enzyme [Chitinispirillales bacterium]|nr:SUMF1/EgtB/PvdO family nonheme iron enzyme [Chitinispirillales bacterium]